MSPAAQALYAQLAKALGVDAIPADAQGIVQLDVGDGGRVVIVPEDAYTLMLLSPATKLHELDYGSLLWLMRRNFHDSPIAPFRIGCDKAGTLVVWGRMPIDGLKGEQLAGLLDAVAAEAALIREELATGDSPDEPAAP
jgi:hypothetical protein